MKIIFSPTKEMNLNNFVDKDWKLSKHTLQVLNHYKKSDLKKVLRINDSVLETANLYLLAFDKSKSKMAIDLYNGLSFRTLNPKTLSESAKIFLNTHLLILSAFYGPIYPNTYIKPYRLDFTSTLRINGDSLLKFWKPIYNSSILEKETVLNLASNEFSDLFDKTKFNWVDFEFYENKNGKLKQHSTISKKGRASVLRYLAENQIDSPEKICSFEDFEIENLGNLIKVIKLSE